MGIVHTIALSVAFLVALLHPDAMPHTRSPSALYCRRARAVHRRFLVAVPPGHSHILVPSAIAEATKTMPRAIDTHIKIEKRSGMESPHFAHAILAIRPLLTNDETKTAHVLNKQAGAARHGGFRREAVHCALQHRHRR